MKKVIKIKLKDSGKNNNPNWHSTFHTETIEFPTAVGKKKKSQGATYNGKNGEIFVHLP